MDINTQVATYFAGEMDKQDDPVSVSFPSITSGNTVTPLIDARRYFGEIRNLLESMGGAGRAGSQFFYVTGWWLPLGPGPGVEGVAEREPSIDPTSRIPISPLDRRRYRGVDPPAMYQPFRLVDDSQGPYPQMADLLVRKAAAGVDVRVMGWVNPLILRSKVAERTVSYWDIVAGTLKSIWYLRELTGEGGRKPLATKVCALTLGHPVGSVHLKMVVAHDGDTPIAFIGGIDFSQYRVAGEMHANSGFQGVDPGADARKPRWHDMAVKIKGPAVQSLYDTYRDLWNAQVVRHATAVSSNQDSHRDEKFLVAGNIVPAVAFGTQMMPLRDDLVPHGDGHRDGHHRVQVARTFPQYNVSQMFYADIVTEQQLGGSTPASLARPLSFAPRGSFEVMIALSRAISSATKYIYIEDNGFVSQEIMRWLNDAIARNNNLKVILLMGAPDPDDPKEGAVGHVEAVNEYLLNGLTEDDDKRRIGLFVRGCNDIVERDANGNVTRTPERMVIHAKVTIIDDLWLLVGSANQARRSLYTDIELSVGILDEDEALAKQVRVDLWGGHFGLQPEQRNELNDLDAALAVWDSRWAPNAQPACQLPPLVVRKTLNNPLPHILRPGTDQVWPYEERNFCLYLDPDSRNLWPDSCR